MVLSFALVFAHLAVMFGLGFLVMLAIGLDPRTIVDAPPLAFVALVITASLDIVLVFVLLLRGIGGLRLRNLGWSRVMPRDIAMGLVGFVGLVATVFLILLAQSGSLAGSIERLVAVLTDYTPTERLLCMLIGCIAAFSEETLFRGVMQPSLQHKLGRRGGLVVTALAFAAYHFRFTPAIFLGKLGVGLVLGWLRDRTGTLWAPALAHVLQWTVLCFM